jgi:acyl carrier protein
MTGNWGVASTTFSLKAGTRGIIIGNMDLEEQVKSILITELRLDDSADMTKLKYGATAAWDSTNHLNVVLALEEAFNLEFEPDEIVKLTTCSNICAEIRNKQSLGG